jgi:hypothetical protein
VSVDDPTIQKKKFADVDTLAVELARVAAL